MILPREAWAKWLMVQGVLYHEPKFARQREAIWAEARRQWAELRRVLANLG